MHYALIIDNGQLSVRQIYKTTSYQHKYVHNLLKIKMHRVTSDYNLDIFLHFYTLTSVKSKTVVGVLAVSFYTETHHDPY